MNNEPKTPPATTTRIPRWLRILGWIGVWIITLVALAIMVENWRGARVWRAYVAEARATGEQLEPEAIIPPPIPDEENFAAVPLFQPLFDYERSRSSAKEFLAEVTWRDPQASERLERMRPFGSSELKPAGDWRRGQFVDLAAGAKQLRGNDSTPGTPAGAPGTELLLALAKFDPEMNALRAAALRPRARFPIHYEDHVSALLPHVEVLRKFTRLAQVRALAELSLGDAEAAQRDLLLGLRLADSISEEPMLISHLVQMAQLELLMAPLWEGLVRHQWKDPQLAATDAALARVDLVAGFQRAVRGERSLFGVLALDALKKHRHMAFSLANLNGTWRPSMTDRALGWLMPSGWIDFNKAYLGDYYGRLIKTADPATHRFLPEEVTRLRREFDREIASARSNPHKALVAVAFPAVVPVQERSASMQATVDLARCAIALERYRLKHGGALPESLAALAPDFLAQVPRDVMSGQMLRYRPDQQAFVLYSVGWNGRDDGGEYAWKPKAKPPRVEWREGDWPWPRPEVRAAAAN